MVGAMIRKGDIWYDMRSHALVTVLSEHSSVGDHEIPYVKLVKIEYMDRETNEVYDVCEMYVLDAEFTRETMCAPFYQITHDVINSKRERGWK